MEIIKKTTAQATWAELKAAAEAGTIDDLIQSGDLIPFTLKTGEKLAVRATHDGNGKLFFVLEDCMEESRCMNKVYTNKGGWKACDMRKHLNTTVFALLPDDLQAVIAPTTIVQVENGERRVTEDKLFLLSRTQVFGKGEWTEYEPEDTQLDIFTREKDRVKECGEYGTYWWWLRSPYSASSGYFHSVTTSGSSHYYLAHTSSGVAFGFCLI